jgi:hypothetical protein
LIGFVEAGDEDVVAGLGGLEVDGCLEMTVEAELVDGGADGAFWVV